MPIELAVDPQTLLTVHPPAQRDQRIHEPEVVERLGSEFAPDPPHVLEARERRFADVHQRIPLRGRLTRRALGPQRDRGQGLTDLIVQFAGDPDPLLLLGGQHAPAALAPLALEPVEHLVQRVGERMDLRTSRVERLGSATRLGWVDRAHGRRQPAERAERAAEQHEVDQQHQDQDDRQDQDLARGGDPMNGHRRPGHDRERHDEHRGVAQENAPQERQSAPGPRAGGGRGRALLRLCWWQRYRRRGGRDADLGRLRAHRSRAGAILAARMWSFWHSGPLPPTSDQSPPNATSDEISFPSVSTGLSLRLSSHLRYQ